MDRGQATWRGTPLPGPAKDLPEQLISLMLDLNCPHAHRERPSVS